MTLHGLAPETLQYRQARTYSMTVLTSLSPVAKNSTGYPSTIAAPGIGADSSKRVLLRHRLPRLPQLLDVGLR
jgi:hypothetical protein